MSDTAPLCRPDTATLRARSGGRAARHSARTAPLADNLRPVRAGLSGGQYKPLTDAEVRRIHEAALTALEEIGLADAPESGVAILTGLAPCWVTTAASAFPARWSRTCWPWPRGASRCTAAMRAMTCT